MNSGVVSPTTARMAPVLAYPSPATWYQWVRMYSERTIISFIVRVPVLSELIALVAPRVSTSVRFFTIALASASSLAP